MLRSAAVSAASLLLFVATTGCGDSSARGVASRSVGRTCHGPITIHGAADLDLLTGCTSIDGDLHIESTTLTSLAGFERLTSVHYLVISGNDALASVSGLSGLHSAVGVTVHANPALGSLAGLENLRSLEGLVITDSGVTSLAGLDGLISVGDLVIVGNPALSTLVGAPRLSAVENLDVEKNGRLTGVAELGRVEIGGASYTDLRGAIVARR